MSEQPPRDEPVKRRFSVFRFILWCLGGLVVVGVGLFGLDQVRSSRRTTATVADLDSTDPGWRLEEIESARVAVPDGQNSAILCKRVVRLLGGKWPDAKFDEQMREVVLPERLDAGRMKRLEEEMERLAPVRRVARPLADMPRGRYELEYAFNPTMTLLPDTQNTRQVARLFHYEMLYLANKGDVSGAIRSCRACLCAGRSLYDEPFMISQLVRIAVLSIGLNGVEEALSLGESGEAELVALDGLLADEEKHDTFLLAIRGERGMVYQLFSRIGAGQITTDSMRAEMAMPEATVVERFYVYPSWQVRRQQPVMMEFMNRMVENARLPSHEQIAGEKAIESDIRGKKISHPLVVLYLPATRKVSEACRRKSAQVATMRGLIAADRYRMKHGKWPAAITEVVPEFLKAVPTDPFDGKPIRMKKVPDGVVVYSVGVDGVDDGGKVDRKRPAAPGYDLGFRLWDKEKRARPASPPKPEGPP